MWMSEPMPVTTRIITADSGSSRNARLTTKSPDAIQVNTFWTTSREPGSIPTSCQTWDTATANEASITRQARPPDTLFDKRRPIEALTRKPTNGRRGISDSTGSPLERRERFGIERLAVPEEPDHERQADGGLGGGDGHDEERDDLSVHRPELAAERNERQVRGVQHDLDRQEQRDQVTAHKDAGRADREQQTGEDEVMLERHVRRIHSVCFRARTTA